MVNETRALNIQMLLERRRERVLVEKPLLMAEAFLEHLSLRQAQDEVFAHSQKLYEIAEDQEHWRSIDFLVIILEPGEEVRCLVVRLCLQLCFGEVP